MRHRQNKTLRKCHYYYYSTFHAQITVTTQTRGWTEIVKKMMNFVAICLVVSSLAAAGVWSPTPEKNVPNKPKERVIVKEGHRIVVVEYDQPGQHGTRVSISPEQEYLMHKPDMEEKISSAAEDALKGAEDALKGAEDRMKKASSVLRNREGVSMSGEGHHGPGELVCDVYGKCKHKIANAISKAKDKAKRAAEITKDEATEVKEKVADAAHEVISYEKEIAFEGKEAVQDALGKVKEGVAEKAHEGKEAVREVLGKAKDGIAQKAHGAKEAVQHAFGKAKEGTSQTAQDVKEGARVSMEKAKGTVKETNDLGKTIGEDVAMNVTEQLGHARDSVMEKAKEAQEGIEQAAKRVKTGAGKFFDRVGHFFYGLMRYMKLPQTLNALMGVLNLVGLAIAYGMCVWVTFVSSYLLAEALPRQQFGMVQSKIYPIYFRAMAFTIGLALLGHMPQVCSSKAGKFQGFNLLASLLMVFANSTYLEPRATKAMFERMKVEKEEGRGRESLIGETSRETDRAATTTSGTGAPASVPERTEQEAIRSKIVKLSERLKKLNTYSSILNILSLMSLSWHLVYLGQRLQMTS